MEGLDDAQLQEMLNLMNFTGEPIFWVMILTSVVSMVLYVLVLINIFKYGGVGKGILGIICSIYAFIWGWLNAKQYEFTPLMLLWTFLTILSFVQYWLFQTVMMQRMTTVIGVMGTGGY